MKIKLLILLFAICEIANSQYTKLYEFAVSPDGKNPIGNLFYDGTFLYGMTQAGGATYGGTIFKIKPDGTGYSKMHDFPTTSNSGGPYGSLISDGTFLYGMTQQGGSNQIACQYGCGTIFKIKPDGTGFMVILDFAGTPNGRNPQGSLIFDGTFLYGVTAGGGAYDYGTIFKIKPDGTGYTKLYDFNSPIKQPVGSLLLEGTFLYGMTYIGGNIGCINNNGCGIIFKIKTDGTAYNTIHLFSGVPNGGNPFGSLISDGTFLYGMTTNGSTNNLGTIFKIKPDGTGYSKLFDFTGATNGGSPKGSLIYDGIFLYGMTTNGGVSNGGVLFKIKPDGTGHTTLLNFNSVGCYAAQGSLITDGTYFYGMTYYGMLNNNNNGTIFKINPIGMGVDEYNAEIQLTVSPNPFSTQTTLETDKYFKNASLTVYNSVGQAVKQIDNLSGQTVILHRDNLPSGVYFVRLTQDGNTISADKFVIADE